MITFAQQQVCRPQARSTSHHRQIDLRSSAAGGWLSYRTPSRHSGWTRCPRSQHARRRGVAITASIFGVGAPEAVLVGVVALVVFGPRGLAQAAKSLGSSLRGVAPFVKEIAGAGTELKRALEEEIGLDDIRNEWRGQGPYPSSSALNSFQGQAESKPSAAKEAAAHEGGTASPAPPGTEAPRLTQVTENMAKTVDPQIDQKRKASEAAAWGGNAPAAAQEEKQQATGGEASSLQGLSMEDLEAELARRKQERQKARKA